LSCLKPQNQMMMASPQNTNALNKQTTELLFSMFEKLCPLLNMNESMERIRPAINALREGKCTLVVIGEIKKGKSSLINALLGLKNVLPVSSDVATATVFRVVYGEKRRNVVVLRSKSDSAKEVNPIDMTEDYLEQEFDRIANQQIVLNEIEVNDEELIFYGTEDGNPKNKKEVDHIRIEVPSEILKRGLEIIDTPGLGGLMKFHADITWNYIPKADAVLFVLESVESPFTKDEQIFLEKIKNLTPLIAFAQTKIDVVDTAKWKSWQDRNLEEISKILSIPQQAIPYFPVSSKGKNYFIEKGKSADYESSRFGSLENFVFNRLLKLHEQIMCLGLLKPMDAEAAEKENELSVSLNIVRTDAEKLADLDALYTEKQKEFVEFEAEEFPELITKLQDRLHDMIAEGEEELNDFLQPTQHNPVVNDFINKIREIDESPRVIKEKIDELSSVFIEACAKKTVKISKKYKNSIAKYVESEFLTLEGRLSDLCVSESETIEETSEEEAKSYSLVRVEKSDSTLPAIVQKPVDLRFSRFDMMRNGFLGVSVGGAIAGKATAIVLSLLFPPALPFAPAIIGGMGLLGSLLGGFFTQKNTQHQQRQQIISHFQQALPGILHQLQKSYVRQYSQVMNDIRRKVRDEQRRLIKTMKQQMNERLKEIRELRKSEGLSVEQRVKQLTQDLKEIQRVRTGIRQATGQKS